MDFSVNPEQEAVIDVARRFAIEHLAPGYRKREKQGRVERTLVADMGRLGLLGVELPKEFGARGAEDVTSGLVLEAIARGDFNVGYVNILVSLVGQIIARFAMPEIAREWLPEMIAGRKLPSLALTEPRGGSDAANIQLSAKRQDGAYVLTGEKVSIGLATQADLSIVFARTGAPEDGAKGVTAFLVPLDIPGLTRAVKERIGSRCVGGGSLSFDGVKVPAHYRLGEENKGFVQVMQGFDYSRALIGLQCVSLAQLSVDETWASIKSRQSFGKPLSAFQGVTFPLAEAETQLSAARLLCLYALWLKDKNLPHTTEAAMCKWWGAKLSFDVVHQCLLLHGHLGYSTDLPFEQRLRDVLGLEIGDGTAQIMKLIIARQKAGRDAVPN